MRKKIILIAVLGFFLSVISAMAGNVQVKQIIYADAGDGFVTFGNNVGIWDAVHDATTCGGGIGSEAGYTSEIAGALTRKTSTAMFLITRGFLSFGTSILPDSVDVTELKLYLFGSWKSDQDNDGQAYVSIIANTTQSSAEALVCEDYNQCGAVDNPALAHDVSENIDIGNWSTVGYNIFNLNSVGRSSVNTTGNTYFGMREGHDIEDSAIVGSNVMSGAYFYTSEHSGVDQDPYLEITYVCDESVAPLIGGTVISVTPVEGSDPPANPCPFLGVLGSDTSSSASASSSVKSAILGMVDNAPVACIRDLSDNSYITSLSFFNDAWIPSPNIPIRFGTDSNGSLVVVVSAYNTQTGEKRIQGKYLDGSEYCNYPLP